MEYRRFNSLDDARDSIRNLAEAESVEDAEDAVGEAQITFETKTSPVTFEVYRREDELEIRAVWYNYLHETISFEEMAEEFNRLSEVEDILLNEVLQNTQFQPAEKAEMHPWRFHEEELEFSIRIQT